LPGLVATAQPDLDYYLIVPGARKIDGIVPQALEIDGAARADAVVVEEFVLGEDFSAVGLSTAVWSAADGRWRNSAAVGRRMRADPTLRARLVTISRSDVEVAYRELSGRELPDESVLRTYLHEYQSLPVSAPLRLSAAPCPAGFHHKRLYRLLFAGNLHGDGLARLRTVWHLYAGRHPQAASDPEAARHGASADDPGRRQAGVVGTACLRLGQDLFIWELRRIGPGLAWCVDVTAYLATESGVAIGPLVRALTTDARQQGLIPVTVDRFC
jgi:hypothetical protein